jgi:hypothetical protein
MNDNFSIGKIGVTEAINSKRATARLILYTTLLNLDNPFIFNYIRMLGIKL